VIDTAVILLQAHPGTEREQHEKVHWGAKASGCDTDATDGNAATTAQRPSRQTATGNERGIGSDLIRMERVSPHNRARANHFFQQGGRGQKSSFFPGHIIVVTLYVDAGTWYL